jgi:hypothetical protein
MTPQELLRHHVTGAIERGEAEAIVGIPAVKRMRIAANKSEFLNSLFAAGGTADGYVLKRSKRFVDVFLAGREFRVNRHLVWCMRESAGQPWQHAVLELGKMGFTLVAADDAARALTTGSEWAGKEIAYQFN